MFKRITHRLDGNTKHGFTVIELLVVIIIIGILLAIAVPSYLGFRDRAADNAAKTNLRAALPAAEAYYADNGTYVGMDMAALKAIDSGLSSNIAVVSVGASSYCLKATDRMFSVKGPGGTFYSSLTCT